MAAIARNFGAKIIKNTGTSLGDSRRIPEDVVKSASHGCTSRGKFKMKRLLLCFRVKVYLIL
jgi:hypothetical protein